MFGVVATRNHISKPMTKAVIDKGFIIFSSMSTTTLSTPVGKVILSAFISVKLRYWFCLATTAALLLYHHNSIIPQSSICVKGNLKITYAGR